MINDAGRGYWLLAKAGVTLLCHCICFPLHLSALKGTSVPLVSERTV